MNKQKTIVFLFSIAKEIEQSFQCPVIYFTEKDYARCIVESLVDLHKALQDNAQQQSNKLFEILKAFHFEWLEAVLDIEAFKKRLKDIPREMILRVIYFTRSCLEDRYNYLSNLIKEMQVGITNEENQLIQANLEIIEEIKQINLNELFEKEKRILTHADQTEYLNQLYDELEELSHWVDMINDNLSLQFCKVLELRVTVLPIQLSNALKQIIEEVSSDPNPETQKIAGIINCSRKRLSNKGRINSLHELEISTVVEEIKELENRIRRLKMQRSPGLLALQHKTMYLEDKLKSLENVKLSLVRLKHENTQGQGKEERIFNHLLPCKERSRLVEQLIKLWEFAFTKYNNESIISILSAADLKEVFTDEEGQFSVDKYGRKIYRKENDPTLYQLNENNELVPVQDDDNHIYFYDECGRYYLNKKKRRIYEAYSGANEYSLNKNGFLMKIKEIKDGTVYFYDWLGRYNFNKDGKKIYHDDDSESLYEPDGLGNLVKIRDSKSLFNYGTHTKKSLSLEENKYLKQVVGPALKECVARVVLLQPNDPIAYLAASLVKYRNNIEERKRRLDEQREILEERNLYCVTEENSLIYLRDYDMVQAEDPYKFDYESQDEEQLQHEELE